MNDAGTSEPQQAETSGVRASAATGRIRGIDAARAVAIVGMVMVHVGPRDTAGQDLAGSLYALPHGRASILFIVLAGVGVSLLAGDRSPERRRGAWGRLAYRAALLLPVGLALQLLGHGVLVILQYYAIFYLVGGLAMPLGDRALARLAAGLAVLAPVAYLAAWHWQPAWFVAHATALTGGPVEVARDLLLSGSYPVLTWTAPLLAGMWLGRRDLRSQHVRRRMAGWGLAVALGAWALSSVLTAALGEPLVEPSWLLLASAEPHSQMPLWLAGATGSATAALGLALAAVDRAGRLAWPLVAAGQLALTIYVGHLFVLAAWPDLLRRGDVAGASWSVLRFTVVVALAAAVWRAVAPRGPLEALLRLPWITPPGRHASGGTGRQGFPRAW